MSVLVSVIIPTFNRGLLVVKAIESVLNQTYKNYEIIIVDDGSTDETSLLLKDLPVQYYKTDNHGVSHARNFAVSKAQGDWIAFLDSDDIWLKDKLEKQVHFLEENPQTYLIHSDEIWIRNGIRVNPHKKHKKGGGDQYIPSLKLCAISPSAVMMSKEKFIDLGGFNEDYPCCEDYDLWLKYTSLYQVGFIDEFLLEKYGGHEDQLSHKYIAMDFWRIKSLDWVLRNRELSIEKRNETLKVLKKKSEILIKGYIKHNNLENLDCVQNIYSLHFVG